MTRAAPLPEAVDVLVCGLGFAGATVARELADRGWRVAAVDARAHIGGNAYDALDDHGVRVHRYGPHAFHTNARRVFDHLGRFTAWRPYEHRVRVALGDRLVPFPINRTTLSVITGRPLDEAGAADWLARARVPRDPIRTSEDLVMATVGPELCELFFRGYSKKHWGLDLSELAVGVAARIPVRTSDDDRYFDDAFQAMPADGYTTLFERLLDHPRLVYTTGLHLGPAELARPRPRHRHLVYTGPIDAFFDHAEGRLPYRSVRFEHLHVPDVDLVQPVAQVNHPGPEVPYYRVTEMKHLTGQVCRGTSLVRESSAAEGDPFYPIPRPANEALYQRYRARAEALPDVTFVGRLATYRYYNMDQVVAAALAAADRVDARLRAGGASPAS